MLAFSTTLFLVPLLRHLEREQKDGAFQGRGDADRMVHVVLALKQCCQQNSLCKLPMALLWIPLYSCTLAYHFSLWCQWRSTEAPQISESQSIKKSHHVCRYLQYFRVISLSYWKLVTVLNHKACKYNHVLYCPWGPIFSSRASPPCFCRLSCLPCTAWEASLGHCFSCRLLVCVPYMQIFNTKEGKAYSSTDTCSKVDICPCWFDKVKHSSTMEVFFVMYPATARFPLKKRQLTKHPG